MGVDPLAAFGGQDSWSPYAAMGNSPGMMVDPDGLQFEGFDYNIPFDLVGPAMVFSDFAMGRGKIDNDIKDIFDAATAREILLSKAKSEHNKINGDKGSGLIASNDLSKEGMPDGGKTRMKSAGEFDYSIDEISGKREEDLDYIKNGQGGNMLTRWWETIKRDWSAEGNEQLRQNISDVAELGAVIPGLGVAKFAAKGVRNAHLAGKVHPKTGVPFDKAGFPNFSNNLYKGGWDK